jgi:hypothetical protein
MEERRQKKQTKGSFVTLPLSVEGDLSKVATGHETGSHLDKDSKANSQEWLARFTLSLTNINVKQFGHCRIITLVCVQEADIRQRVISQGFTASTVPQCEN